MLRRVLILAVCAFACLAGDCAIKTHERLKYSTTAVKPGVWSLQFDKCRKLAIESGVPLVVLWVNPGCAHCRELCYSIADSPLFDKWRTDSGFVFVIGIGRTTKTGEKVKEFAKVDRLKSISSYPFCAVYLNPIGKTSSSIKRVFTGSGLSATGFRKQVSTILRNYAKITLKSSSGGTVRQVSWQQKGKKVTLKATSDRGYRLLGWYDQKGNLVSKKASYKITVKKNVTYTAKFKKE